ncbi:MAG TPA: hypothetical protein VLA59_03210 [Patescibacteria group bacterium]|nr:hypothetical protein [Patescibacteria group bacterium]
MNRVRGVVRATLEPVIVVPLLLAGCASPSPASSLEPSESPPSGPVATGAVGPTVAAGFDLGDIVWVYTPPPSTLGGPNGAFRLEAGTLAADEPIVNLQIPWRAELVEGIARDPAIGAPHDGAVVYVADDALASEVHRVEIVADGRDEVLARLDEVIWDIVVAPDGSAAYAAVSDRADQTRDLGVVRIALDGSGGVEPILPPAQPAAADAVRRVATVASQVHLAISSDGKHLVRHTCQNAGTCLMEVADLATGRTVELPDREVLGVVSGLIVARGCHGPGCGLHVIDLETQAVASAGVDISGHLVEVDGEPVVVAVFLDGRGLFTVEAVNPISGRRQVLHRVAAGTDVLYSDFLFLQLDLPEGLVHMIEVTPGGDGAAASRERHLLISIEERRAVEVPRPAFTQPCGPGCHG